MRYIDLDFFEPERERLLIKRKKMIPLIILAVFLILMLILIIYLQTTLTKLTSTLEEKNEIVRTTETNNAKIEASIDQSENSIQMYENGQMGSTIDTIVIKEINAQHLQAITNSTPKEAFYSNFRFEENALTLEGYATNTQVVAKIVYNLENTGLYENVVITNITNDENSNYKFIISADIKE